MADNYSSAYSYPTTQPVNYGYTYVPQNGGYTGTTSNGSNFSVQSLPAGLTPSSSSTVSTAANYHPKTGSVLGLSTDSQATNYDTNSQTYTPTTNTTNTTNTSTTAYNPSAVWDTNTGKTYQSAYQEGLIDQYGNVLTHPEGPDMNAINSIFDESNNYLNQAEGNLNTQKDSTIQDILAQFERGKLTAGQGRESALGTIQQNLGGINTRKEDSLGANRRLYQELGLGGQQRFGGASSAGQAYSEIIGREQQRQQGQIQRDYVQATQQIEGQKVQVEKDYANSIQNLELQKNTAVNEVTRDFQNKLLEITRMRGANEQAKQQAKLGALQDYKNQIYQINLQNAQFQQSLYAQKQAADLQLSMYQKQLGLQTAGSSSTFSDFANRSTSTPNSAFAFNNANYSSPNGQSLQVSPAGQIIQGNKAKSIFDELNMGL